MSKKCQECKKNLHYSEDMIHYSIGQAIQLVRFSIEVFMTTSSISPNFYALRHDRSEVVGCHNLASALAIAEGRAPSLDTSFIDGHYTYKCKAFVSPLGQYYVEIFAGSQIVRMDVANAQTALYYVKNGCDADLTREAYISNLSQ